jgi:hypothetical protein
LLARCICLKLLLLNGFFAAMNAKWLTRKNIVEELKKLVNILARWILSIFYQ